MRFTMSMRLSRMRRYCTNALYTNFFKKHSRSLVLAARSTTRNCEHSSALPSANWVPSRVRNKADAYFAGLTCYYERLIAERRHRIPVATLYFQQHTFQYTSHVSLDRKCLLAWIAQRSKVFLITVLRDENVSGNSSSICSSIS